MNAFDYSKKYVTCAVCGDIHGEFDFLVGKMLRMELTDTLVIVAGDCGIGFDTPGYYRRTYQRIAKTTRSCASEVLRIDTVVTHTAPSFCYPTTKRGIEMWMAYDPNLGKDIDEERATMDRLHNRLLSDGHPLT